MEERAKNWKVLNKLNKPFPKAKVEDVVKLLLANRKLRTAKEKQEFFKPTTPDKITLRKLGLKKAFFQKAISRIKLAIEKRQKVVIYGDYDADGVTAVAILWETLNSLGVDVLPYIPERFSEGYGINEESIKKLKNQYPKLELIITVDNGIVAKDAVAAANSLGIDVIIIDHHQKGETLPKALGIIHTTDIGGAALAWIFAREIGIAFGLKKQSWGNGLDLAAIGTIADQLPLIGPNRSFAKYGLEALNLTERPGLLALFEAARVEKEKINTYTVGFMLAPRINAMGRLEHAIDSLRLLCTRRHERARKLALHLNKVNLERQRIVEEVVWHAGKLAEETKFTGAILVAHESYHEGVIGLVAAKLVEKYYRPAIVFSKGKVYSKASARSIPGFNIVEAIRKLDHLLEGGGGHPMAAGFSIETKKLDQFIKEFDRVSKKLLTDDILTPSLKIDMELPFSLINQELADRIAAFEPTGIGNPAPTFLTRDIKVIDAKTVGKDAKHLKLTLKKDEKIFDAIAFGFGEYFSRLSPDKPISAVYVLEENVWNGTKSLQLRIKDIKLS